MSMALQHGQSIESIGHQKHTTLTAHSSGSMKGGHAGLTAKDAKPANRGTAEERAVHLIHLQRSMLRLAGQGGGGLLGLWPCSLVGGLPCHWKLVVPGRHHAAGRQP